jgi:hypothetical protein
MSAPLAQPRDATAPPIHDRRVSGRRFGVLVPMQPELRPLAKAVARHEHRGGRSAKALVHGIAQN